MWPETSPVSLNRFRYETDRRGPRAGKVRKNFRYFRRIRACRPVAAWARMGLLAPLCDPEIDRCARIPWVQSFARGRAGRMEQPLRLTLAAVLAALALAPAARHAAAQDALALCRERHGAAAVEVCAAAVKAHPGDEALHRRLAYLYVEIDRYDRAIETLTAMARRWPDHWQPHYDLAQIYAFVRGYAAAVAPIEKAIALRPKDSQSLMLAVAIYSSLKRETEAFQAALRAAELGDRVAMYLVSYHYEEGLGVRADPKKAGQWLLRAAEAGHVAAMDRVTELYLEGGLGLQADDRQAELWATRAHHARNGGSMR